VVAELASIWMALTVEVLFASWEVQENISTVVVLFVMWEEPASTAYSGLLALRLGEEEH